MTPKLSHLISYKCKLKDCCIGENCRCYRYINVPVMQKAFPPQGCSFMLIHVLFLTELFILRIKRKSSLSIVVFVVFFVLPEVFLNSTKGNAVA